MEHDLQKKQELELWNMVSSGKPRQGAKTPSRTPQRMKQEVPNQDHRTISRSKKQHRYRDEKRHESAEYIFIG